MIRLAATIAGALTGAVALTAAGLAGLAGAASARPVDGAPVDLAPIVAAWPDAYTVTGSKSEPLYTEHILLARDGDDFALRIEVVGQGDTAFGTQTSGVRVDAAGTVSWTTGCTKEPASCADDGSLRGFLATAALIGLARQERLPVSGIARTLHGAPVVCVDDAALHPDAPPAVVALDPCFDRATGAVLAHWSPDSGAFVAATLAPGFTVSSS